MIVWCEDDRASLIGYERIEDPGESCRFLMKK